jgi:hypothetical protein
MSAKDIGGGNNYVRSLELNSSANLTTGTFNLLSKIRAKSALGGCFGL